MSGSLNEAFLALLILGALALWWHAAVQARERARDIARAFCHRQAWQLLDQTVALISMRPRRHEGRWALCRRYRFDFSPDGGQRRSGELALVGKCVERISADIGDGACLIE